jgi:hypothetical protein
MIRSRSSVASFLRAVLAPFLVPLLVLGASAAASAMPTRLSPEEMGNVKGAAFWACNQAAACQIACSQFNPPHDYFSRWKCWPIGRKICGSSLNPFANCENDQWQSCCRVKYHVFDNCAYSEEDEWQNQYYYNDFCVTC